ncbi:hypothetical protein LSH36_38g01036 [Paralvinella palmiformis]|uniref:Polyprenal reductase n=1 Tax=Paralvinella palmiformis TaxID=53620 RepID=A0AAD9K9I9_9ANNE|nr:hypothetical protein LSH36_38g01036 [Paralvinella palmiformis]
MAAVLLCLYWFLFSVACWLLAAIHIYDLKLPQLINDILLFGKMKDKKRKWTIAQWFEMPKRWFIHFYIVGSLTNGYFTYLYVCSYIFHHKPPTWLTFVLHFLAGVPSNASTGPGSALLLLLLMFIQTFRRLFECMFVSVYSRSTINIIHYIMGISLYTLFPLCVLCEAPNLQTVTSNNIKDDLFIIRHIAGGVMFLVASWQQNQIHRQFAALRKDDHGRIKTLHHKIPEGGWFQYISCPHYLMELVIYASFIVVAGPHHITLWTVFMFVVSNQLLSASLTHSWYKSTYKDYPSRRKAIIPYLL